MRKMSACSSVIWAATFTAPISMDQTRRFCFLPRGIWPAWLTPKFPQVLNEGLNGLAIQKEIVMSSPASAFTLENVLYEKKGPIAYVTISRPKVLNALNARTISELRSAFENARDDSEVRGVVFTGAGDKAFAAGADISEMANDTP